MSPGYRNLVEPENLVRLFTAHPPVDFAVSENDGLPVFDTGFDLLTTLETPLRKKLARWGVLRMLGKALTLPTRFGGTTITEFSPLPWGRSPTAIIDSLLAPSGTGKPSLIILKDLPCNSPLLPDEDNALADEISLAARQRDFLEIDGQALAYVPLDFPTVDAYMARLSASRRKDFRRKLRSRASLDHDVWPLSDPRFADPALLDAMYAMYLEVYDQSEIHFDLLSRDFFAALLTSPTIPGQVFWYRHDGQLVGWNICLEHNGLLIDKYIGFRYPQAREHNLYFVSWMVNLEYALSAGCHAYVAGWTDPEVKASLGASFTRTRHLVWVRNPVLRRVLTPFRHLFENDARTLDGRN